jgi:hypothetical protein
MDIWILLLAALVLMVAAAIWWRRRHLHPQGGRDILGRRRRGTEFPPVRRPPD